jgi:DNA polymerase-3 subunit gamma/tau
VSEYESEELFAPELIEQLAKAISAEDAQLYYQTAIIGRRDLALAPEPRVGFEMTLLRMLVFRPSADTYAAAAAPPSSSGGQSAARPSGAAQARAAATGGGAGGVRASDAAPSGSSRASGSAPPSGGAARSGDVLGSARRVDGGASAPARPGGARSDTSSVSADGAGLGTQGAGDSHNASAPGAGVATGVDAGPGSWSAILAQLEVSGLARQLANNCVLIGRTGNLVRLGLDPRNNMMRVPGAVDKLTQALSKYFGETVRLDFEAPIAGAETPAQAEKRAVVEELDSARQSLESDPAVRALRETFGATLLPDSVRPLK